MYKAKSADNFECCATHWSEAIVNLQQHEN